MIKFSDSVSIGDVKKTSEGYLVATSRIARTGVQEYLASELGIIGDGVIRINRPANEVFAKDALASLSRAPITINHPTEMVDADNWADLAVGEIGDNVMRDGEWIVVNPMIKDAKGRAVAETTHKELSLGYTAELQDAPAGADYDFDMVGFKFNHLALVPQARAGHQARIGDSAINWGAAPLTVKDKEPKMDLIKVMVGDKAVQVAADDANTVTALVADHQKVVDGLKAELASVKIEAADAAKSVKTDEEIAQMVADSVAEIAEVSAKAVKLVDGYDAAGKDAMTIRRDVIAAVYGDEAVADLQSDAEITAAFKVARSTVADKTREVLKDRKTPSDDPWAGNFKEKGSK